MNKCLIDGCSKAAHNKRGWCNAHYQRWLKHGDPLKGGTPKGEPQRYFRDVVLTYEGDECLAWPYANDGDGYGSIYHDGKTKRVHRAVCEEVYGPPPTPDHDASHSCGRGSDACCAKRHLSWKTHAANMADMVMHGTSRRGEKSPFAKLNEEQVRKILALKGAAPQHVIAKLVGTSRANVGHIHNRETWGHVIEAALYASEDARERFAGELEAA